MGETYWENSIDIDYETGAVTFIRREKELGRMDWLRGWQDGEYTGKQQAVRVMGEIIDLTSRQD